MNMNNSIKNEASNFLEKVITCKTISSEKQAMESVDTVTKKN